MRRLSTEHLHYLMIRQIQAMAIFDTINGHLLRLITPDGPLQFQIMLLDYNDFVGRIGIGRLQWDSKSWPSYRFKLTTTKNFRVTKLFGFFGLERLVKSSQSEVTVPFQVWKTSLGEQLLYGCSWGIASSSSTNQSYSNDLLGGCSPICRSWGNGSLLVRLKSALQKLSCKQAVSLR